MSTLSNRDFIAAYQERRQRPGVAAAKQEVLLICPCCRTPNLSERGLAVHCCRAKPDRGRLTPGELDLARRAACPVPSFQITPHP